MLMVLKIAGVSACLSAGLVSALEPRTGAVPAAGKAFVHRIEPEVAPRIRLADGARVSTVADACGAAWPYRTADCGTHGSDETRKTVRTITIEHRDAPATSRLVRVPVDATNSR